MFKTQYRYDDDGNLTSLKRPDGKAILVRMGFHGCYGKQKNIFKTQQPEVRADFSI